MCFFPWKGACYHLFTSTTCLPLTLLPIKESTTLKSSTETLGEFKKVEQIEDSDFAFGGDERKNPQMFQAWMSSMHPQIKSCCFFKPSVFRLLW